MARRRARATYFEPIIRARAGWIDEQAVWDEFMRSMPQGLPAVGRIGLEKGESYRDIYWGGAIYCLLADLEIREKTGGRSGSSRASAPCSRRAATPRSLEPLSGVEGGR